MPYFFISKLILQYFLFSDKIKATVIEAIFSMKDFIKLNDYMKVDIHKTEEIRDVMFSVEKRK